MMQENLSLRQFATAQAHIRASKAETLDLGFAPDDQAALLLDVLSDPNRQAWSSDALQALTLRNQKLLDSPAEEIASALVRQIVVMETCFNHYMARAALAKAPADSVILGKLALSAQAALLRTLSALHLVTSQLNKSLNLDQDYLP